MGQDMTRERMPVSRILSWMRRVVPIASCFLVVPTSVFGAYLLPLQQQEQHSSPRSMRIPCLYCAPSRNLLVLRAAYRQEGNVDGIADMELQALASAKAALDKNRLLQALEPPTEDAADPLLSNSSSRSPPWKLALAASALCAVGSFLVWHSALLAVTVAAVVFGAANADPLDDDSLLGAVARLLGRATIRSVQATQPTVRAVARAVVTGEEELLALRQQVERLQNENRELRHWKETRLKLEDSLSAFALVDLKHLARQNNLPLGGTKLQLLSRLVEAGLIEL